ncbi:MAG: quinone oxidoreductase [Deltaproteobacteria bacterium]|nr:quinone oxidoreductase [Deltaproteobacteria bacterium]
MRAIQIDQTGGPEVLQVADLTLKKPHSGEIRVRNHAIGVNFIDTYHRTGLYKLELPHTLGVEGAGVVEDVGPGVASFQVGDRVAYAIKTPGSYAEEINLEAQYAVKLPPEISFETGAAMMLKGLTVEFLLRRLYIHPEPGEKILWHAAAGGVGLIACQWAKAKGIELIGTAGSREKCELAREHGAAHVIDYKKEDVVARVRELTDGRGVRIVYDSVGADTWERSLDCLQPLGLMVSFGNASGPVPPMSLLTLSQKGSLYVTRPTMFSYFARYGSEMMTAVVDIVKSGKVKLDAPRQYPLDQAAQAHADLEARATIGSVVLVP